MAPRAARRRRVKKNRDAFSRARASATDRARAARRKTFMSRDPSRRGAARPLEKTIHRGGYTRGYTPRARPPARVPPITRGVHADPTRAYTTCAIAIKPLESRVDARRREIKKSLDD